MTEPAGGFLYENPCRRDALAAYVDLIGGLVPLRRGRFHGAVPEGTLAPANPEEVMRALLAGVTMPEGFGLEDVGLMGFASEPYAAQGVAVAVTGRSSGRSSARSLSRGLRDAGRRPAYGPVRRGAEARHLLTGESDATTWSEGGRAGALVVLSRADAPVPGWSHPRIIVTWTCSSDSLSCWW